MAGVGRFEKGRRWLSGRRPSGARRARRCRGDSDAGAKGGDARRRVHARARLHVRGERCSDSSRSWRLCGRT